MALRPQPASEDPLPPPPRNPREPQRIAKLLARAGVASRREIERMIEEGRIAIAGTPIDKPATLLTSLHGVTVDGQPVNAPAPARLFRYHKPVGLLTAAKDPQGRPTIYDRLPKDLPRVMPVGRLDMNTEGLLLLTTDGELKRQLELPSSKVERTYRARAFGAVSQDQLEELIHGVEIEGIRYGPIDANLERRTGRNTWIEMRLTEGKNREVRRVLEHLGLQVSRLIRVAYGPFILGDLPPGMVDEVRQHDLVEFRRDPNNPPRHGEGNRAKRGGGGPPPGRAPARPPRTDAQTAPRPPRRAPAEDVRPTTSKQRRTATDPRRRPRDEEARQHDPVESRRGPPKNPLRDGKGGGGGSASRGDAESRNRLQSSREAKRGGGGPATRNRQQITRDAQPGGGGPPPGKKPRPPRPSRPRSPSPSRGGSK